MRFAAARIYGEKRFFVMILQGIVWQAALIFAWKNNVK